MEKIDLIESVPDFWTFWKENGINTDEEISVMFTFYSAFDKESSNFVIELERKGYKVDRKSKRTMIFFKGFEIMAEKTKRWTLEELTTAIKELETTAKENETIL